MEWASSLPVQLGAFGLLCSVIGYVARLVVTGQLIPKSTYEQLRKASDEAIARLSKENTEWKEAYRAAEAAKYLILTQNGDLLELSRTLEHTVRKIKELP